MYKPDSQGEGEQGAQGEQGDLGSKGRARRPSAGEVQEIRRLVYEGPTPHLARAEVLGEPSRRSGSRRGGTQER
jgi:hypothetical protein